MPYGISNSQSDCGNWATVKQNSDGSYETIGCHESKQDAIDQMVAVSIAEDIEPIGEVRALPDNYRPALADDVPEGRACGNCAYYDESNKDESGTKAYCTRWNEYVDGAFYCNAWEPYEDDEEEDEEEDEYGEVELRAVDLSAPNFMRTNARKGLKYHEQGLSGDGLQPQTVADARKMASGVITEAKWRKIAPWIARHLVDLEAEGVAEGDITAGIVAHYLWGSGSTKRQATRTMNYAQRIVDQLDEEERMQNVVEDISTNNWVVAEDGTENRRIAFSNMEVRAMGDGTKLVGYAAVFDSPSEPLPWTEYVKRGAFTKTINDGADVRLLIDHEGVPLARSTSGTLTLTEDDRGLLVESELDPTNPDAARLISALRRGDISQMSFAFRTIKDSWNNDRSVRELREVQLFDVSVVTFPAYESTVAELRAKQEVATIAETNNLALRRRQIQIARYK